MIYDVTVRITNTMPVWPGDPAVQLLPQSQESRDKTHIMSLTVITMGSHTGTHIDAPFHMIRGGKRLHEIPLDILVGKAMVLEIDARRSIGRAQLQGVNWKGVERVLFKTENSAHWQDGKFYEEFVYLEPDAAEFLVDCGVRLVGIDYLSIDNFNSASHPTHLALLENDVLIIEGLNLNGIRPGEYTLYALPLNLQDADGAPTRVLLIN